jgi:16S rRNA (guanine527-N7)-methyltransferase
MSLAAELAGGLESLGSALPVGAEERLLAYLALIEKWNRVYSLTAVRNPANMLHQHLLDSLAVLPHLSGERILDVGSGAGLPGIPLAIAWPHARVTLIDANHKKAAFLRQAVIELNLNNAAVVCDRVERWHPEGYFDVVISRAFSDLGQFIELAGSLCGRDGMLAAMKGVYPHEELSQIPAGFKLSEVVALTIPGLEARRHLVIVRPA